MTARLRMERSAVNRGREEIYRPPKRTTCEFDARRASRRPHCPVLLRRAARVTCYLNRILSLAVREARPISCSVPPRHAVQHFLHARPSCRSFDSRRVALECRHSSLLDRRTGKGLVAALPSILQMGLAYSVSQSPGTLRPLWMNRLPAANALRHTQVRSRLDCVHCARSME